MKGLVTDDGIWRTEVGFVERGLPHLVRSIHNLSLLTVVYVGMFQMGGGVGYHDDSECGAVHGRDPELRGKTGPSRQAHPNREDRSVKTQVKPVIVRKVGSTRMGTFVTGDSTISSNNVVMVTLWNFRKNQSLRVLTKPLVSDFLE